MLTATEDEIERIRAYMLSQAPDLTVEFVQKLYSENVLNVRHDIWDVHTNVDRWWVITEPTNLYAQDQFPNMDLALTFHIGLCLRIPRGDRPKLGELSVEPFAECHRYLQEASEAFSHAAEVADYQSIGVRCREALLAFAGAAQAVLPWTSTEEPPKKGDLKAWADHICSIALSGTSHEHRRHLFKTLLESSWKFSNWLTHAKGSHWHDAEAALASTENAVGLCTTAVIRHIRGVPEHCPACGSQRLSPERGYHQALPDVLWERPTCDTCGWTGERVPVKEPADARPQPERHVPEGECVVPTAPLRHLRRPEDSG